jgi:hypothetical protein
MSTATTDATALQHVVPIRKKDEKRRIVTGVVLEPEVVDLQEDITSADEIELAAHEFLASYNSGTQIGDMHEEFDRTIELVESYIAPVDFTIDGEIVRKGSWVISVRVVDDDAWERVESGELTGFSIGGVARAEQIG